MRTRLLNPRAPEKSRDSQARPNGPGWKPFLHIDQLRPRGAAQSGYVNGAYNCAPATVAMVARGWGRMGHLNDAQLVTALAEDIVTPKGTTPDGVAKMLERVSVPIAGPSLAGRFDNDRVMARLRQGNMLIAQVALYDPKKDEVSSHYVLVRKLNPDGTYLISDPMRRKPYTVTPQQLGWAVNNAPPDGGVMIPIGRPGGDLKPRVNEEGSGSRYQSRRSRDDGDDPMSRSRGGRARDDGDDPMSRSRGGRARDEFTSDKPRVAWQSGLIPSVRLPAPPPRPGTPGNAAFTATDDVFVGVDTTFQQVNNAVGSNIMRHNEARNHQVVDLSYFEEPNTEEAAPERQVMPSNTTPLEFAQQLSRLKGRGDPRADVLLYQLENSPFQKDKDVLKLLEGMERKQPGIGKKTNIESFG
jgi:hypothetical protein